MLKLKKKISKAKYLTHKNEEKIEVMQLIICTFGSKSK